MNRTVPSVAHRLGAVLSVPRYRRTALGAAGVYLILFMIALQDISSGGRGFDFLSVSPWQMFDRTGAFTFEAIAMVILPGLTILISPLNLLMGLVLSVLVGLNLAITYLALRQPKACSFNRSSGVLASIPGLLAGSACCAPAIVLILGLQLSSLLVTVFQILIPASAVLLLVTLKLILDRTDPALVVAGGEVGPHGPGGSGEALPRGRQGVYGGEPEAKVQE